jgi:hypothetical protein
MKRSLLEQAALVLMGIVTGVAVSHVLQAGPKATLTPEVYLEVQQTLYQNYRSTIGVIEILTLVAVGTVVFTDRLNTSLRATTTLALVTLVVMFVIWAAGLNPINLAVSSWTPASMPGNWELVRNRWHDLHAARAVLSVVALVALAARPILREYDPSPFFPTRRRRTNNLRRSAS